MINQKINYLIISVICISALFVYVVSGLTHVNKHTHPNEVDTESYLANAYVVKESGGMVGLLYHLVTGRYHEANRHPLYLMLLSVFAQQDITFFIHAKLFSWCVGLIFLAALFWIAYRLGNIYVALAAVGVLAVNVAFLNLTTMVTPVALESLWTLAAWYFIMRGTEKGRSFVYAGVLCGLAYLTKASGLFILISYAIAGLIIYHKNIFKQRHYWLFFVGFIVVSAPLLIRNLVVYHNPVYNDNMSVMWLDSWDEVHTLEYKEEPRQFTFMTYVRTHTLHEAGERLLTGLKDQYLIFSRINTLTVTRPWGRWTALPMVIFFLIGCRTLDRKKIIFTITFFVVSLVLFAWFSYIVHVPRFLVPLMPIYVIISMMGMWTLVQWGIRSTRRATYLWLSMIVILVLCGSVEAWLDRDLSNPRDSYEFVDGYYPLMEQLALCSQTSKILFGPVRSYPLFYFSDKINTSNVEFYLPLVDTIDELHKYCEAKNIEYILIDQETIESRDLFEEYLLYDNDDGVIIQELPPGWEPVFRDPSERPDYVIFRL